jgi:nucleoid-associated protein YgaU
MDPAVKTAMAFCVLLAGICAALLFRRDPARPAPPVPRTAELLLIRHRLGTLGSGLPSHEPGRSMLSERSATSTFAGPRAATVITPSDRQEPPPPLAESYPQAERPASSRWGTSMDMLLPVATPADETARSHKIVDGDTLAALAQRYLGSAARAEEIFKANRDVLNDPELLPIGAELKIPPRGSGPAGATSLPPDPSPERPLVPVR